MDLKEYEEKQKLYERVGVWSLESNDKEEDEEEEMEKRLLTNMRVIKFNKGERKNLQISHRHSKRQATRRRHPRQHDNNLSAPSASQLSQATSCSSRKHHPKPLSLFILISSLMLIIGASCPLNILLLAMSHELPSNASLMQQQQHQHQPPPSQLFLPPVNQFMHSVSLVNGYHQKKSEEEEDGFIMQASSQVLQNETTTTTTTTTSTTTTEAPPSTQTMDARGEPGVDNDERIPIDMNRQQFVTHDQLSLLNASTKDENIYLSSSSDEAGDEDPAGAQVRTRNEQFDDTKHKLATSRSGMSKVSHVSSFLSDLFDYAIRPRPVEETFLASSGGGNQRQTSQQTTTTTTTTSTPTTTSSKPQQQPASTLNICPGVCRSFLTASILCRNEINAPCPSLLQSCCDEDDVPFNETASETPPDSEPNPAQLSGNTSQAQESTQLAGQASTSNATSISSSSSSSSSSPTPTTTSAPSPATAADHSGAGAQVGQRATPGSPIDFLLDAAGPDQPVLGDQQNDRRLGYDLSFRQQQSLESAGATAKNSSYEQAPVAETGLITSDGVNEHALISGSSGSPTSAASSFEVSAPMESKCSGYCTLPLFTMLCDSTYRSADCGPNQKCCVTNARPDSEGSGTSQQQAASEHLGGERQQVQSQACQGSCLPVYHSSLCTKPNEIQLEAPGCLPSFVCCAHPLVQQDGGGGNNIEEVDAMMGAGSSSIVDQHHGLHQPVPSEASYIKDNTLFTSLLPPPPPTISQQLASGGDQQQLLVQEKMNDPMIVASPRQRQASMSLLQSVQDQLAFQQQQQQQQVFATRAPSTKTSQSGGIMSHLYQMFKPSGPGKQRQRTQQQQQLQQQHRQQQFQYSQQPQLQYSGLNYVPQIYDAYPTQLQQHRIPAPSPQHQQQQPQQVMFPPLQTGHNLMFGQTPQFANGYSLGNDGTGLIDMPKQVIINNHNGNSRNRLYGNSPAAPGPAREQQSFMSGHAQPAAAAVNPPQVQKFNPPGPQVQPKITYQSAPPQAFGQFNENNPLYGEKFAQSSDQMPTMMMPKTPTAVQQHQQPNKPMSNQHQQQVASAAKPVAASNQQAPPASVQMSPGAAFAASSANPSPNSNERQRYYPIAANIHDNAHIAPFDQLTSQKHHHHHQSYPQQQQQPMVAFPQTDTSPQKQQQQRQQLQGINKLEPQLVVQNGNRPIGNNISPIRAQQQQQPDHRHHSVVSKNGNGQDMSGEQQKTVWRQNAVSGSPAPPPVDARPFNLELNEASVAVATNIHPNTKQQQVVRTAPSSTMQQAGNSWQSMAPDHQQATSGEVSNKRGTVDRSATKSSSGTRTSSAALDSMYPMQAPPTSSLTPLPSNLNVMITNGPYLDLQRVENNLEASRRQLLVGGSQSLGDALVVAVAPARDDRRTTRVPPTPVVVQNWQPASLGANDDLSHSSSTNAQMAPMCPSSCLPPFVSFNCVRPHYLDENFACSQPGAVCCVKGSNTPVQVPNSPQPIRVDPPKSSQQTSTSPQNFGDNILDNNKLDLTGEPDEQLDEISKQQQPQVVSEIQPTDETSDTQSSATNTGQTQNDEQNLSLSNKNKAKGGGACGIPGSRRRANSGRVMGGFEAKPGYWCWQAALMNNKNEYLCGGALIGSRWVLTAAHCITQHLRSESQLYVRLGQHNLNSSQSIDGDAKSIQVKTSYVHHNHNGITLDNDIALLRLEEPVDQDDPAVCTVCLPERSSQMEPGKRCVVTGYGFEDENGPAVLRVKQAELPIVADQECQKKTGAVLGKPFTLPASSFCAGGELGQDACHGDGGSPLSCLVDGYYELTGIVSWGYKCGSKDLPGLYSKVSTFVGWINQIVSVNN